MNNLIAGAADWFDDRTGLVTAVKRFLDEDIPASSGWHQVFGSIALFLFLLQVFTVALLLFQSLCALFQFDISVAPILAALGASPESK